MKKKDHATKHATKKDSATKKDRATNDMGTASLTGRKSVQTMRTSRFEQFHCGTHWLNLYVQGEIIKY